MNEPAPNPDHPPPDSLQAVLARSRAGRIAAEILTDANRFWVLFLLFFLSLVVVAELFRGLRAEPHGDIRLYQRVAESAGAGQMPYRDFELEYPPYALPFFLLPGLFKLKSAGGFPGTFSGQMLLLDFLSKCLLLWLAVRVWRAARANDQCSPPAKGYLPLVVFALMTAPNHHFYLQRYDLIPAVLCLGVLLAWWREKYLLAGLLLMFGAGVKLYPLILAPPLLLAAWKLGRARPFGLGLALGALPLLLLAPVMPWWKFLAFHAERGLQCESLAAALIWNGRHLGLWEAQWTGAKAWMDVTGPVAAAVLPYAKIVFVAATLAAVLAAGRRVGRAAEPLTVPQLAEILLLPLTAFVAFNTVLSPQYMIWLAPVAAVAALRRWSRPLLWIVIAAFITPIIFPGYLYSTGSSVVESLVMLIRNGLLVLATVQLFLQLHRET